MISDSFLLLMDYRPYFTGATGLGYLVDSYSTTKGLGNPMVNYYAGRRTGRGIITEMPNSFKIIKTSASFKDFLPSSALAPTSAKPSWG